MQKVVIISNQGMSAADLLEIARHNAVVRLSDTALSAMAASFQLDSEHWLIDTCQLNNAHNCNVRLFVHMQPELEHQLSAKW
jgi:hypothetical protein